MFWRVGAPTETAADKVLRYEVEELGNEYLLNQAAVSLGVPASEVYSTLAGARCLWVCAAKKAARRYGTPTRVEVKGIPLCYDLDGGILVISFWRRPCAG